MTSSDLLLDLRPIIAGGGDPFELVLSVAKPMPKGWIGSIDAPFDPLPLRRILASIGFSSMVEQLADSHWRVHLRRDGRGILGGPNSPAGCQGGRVPDEVDLRGLTPPQPMLAILRLTAHLGAGKVVCVILDRDPVFLYPELAEIGWRLVPEPQEGAPYRFRLESAS